MKKYIIGILISLGLMYLVFAPFDFTNYPVIRFTIAVLLSILGQSISEKEVKD